MESGFTAAQKSVAGITVSIKNFRQVTEWLYRGGQPKIKDLELLQQAGIRTVISLRWNKKVIASEKAQASKLGLYYESLPLNYWSWPSDEGVRRFLSIVDDESRRSIFVHCLHGSDRTGVLIAVFRMARQGWDAEAAYREMKECGFHQLWVYHMKWAVFGFEHKLKAGQVF